MQNRFRLLLAASAASLIAGCSKQATEEAAPAEPASEPEAAEVEPMMEAETDTAPIGSATITITLENNAPVFSAVSSGYCIPHESCVSGVNLNAEGNVDLSTFPEGDITINVTLDDAAWAANYRFPSDPYQAVAIVIWPAGTSEPTPTFGQANWPAEFQAPSVSSDQRTLTFIDDDDDQQNYEYDIGLNGPNGRVVLDPKIENGGEPPEPEPVPQ
jgi:hypothetical protein